MDKLIIKEKNLKLTNWFTKEMIYLFLNDVPLSVVFYINDSQEVGEQGVYYSKSDSLSPVL